MAWSVCDGLPQEARKELWNYMRLKKPSYKAVVAGLDWCDADQMESYLQHAIDEGLRLQPEQACDLLEYWPEGYRHILSVTEGSFSQDESVFVQELLLAFDQRPDDIMKFMGAHNALFNCDSKGEFDFYEGVTSTSAHDEQQDLDRERAMQERQRARTSGGLFAGGLLPALFGGAFGGANDGGGARSSVFEDVPFQDFNNAWGFNNDHNWNADGDTQWDSHGDGFPGGEDSF